MIFHSLYQWLGMALLATATAPALWRGGWPERSAAVAMIIAWLGSGLFQNGMQLLGLQVGVMAIDIALLAVLLTIALYSDRWWPMWACGFHGLCVVLHLAAVLDTKVWGRAIFIAGTLFSFLTLLALFIGALGRSARRAVEDPLID